MVINGYYWLMVWSIWMIFNHHIGNFIIPTDEVHHFSEGVNSTTNQDNQFRD
jgi:hypothetical protein